jgi:hypothetical protein
MVRITSYKVDENNKGEHGKPIFDTETIEMRHSRIVAP